MPPVAVFRFSATEGPAYFGEWLDAHGIAWELVPLDAGAAVPGDATRYAGIGMMGGPMSVNDALPWIAPLGALLRDAVARDVPVIGHCLGGQLLAQALGAEVRRAAQAEIGWVDVHVDPLAGAAAAPWFGARTTFPVFQWHYDAFALPPGATRLLTNANNPNQAYAIGTRHVGMQCHVEMTAALVDVWCRSGGDELPRASTPAIQSEAEIRRDVEARVAALHGVASGIYAHWVRGLRR
ncbi:MAG: type 1 glutamine amidotransferase [Proteobacteria bacterium]|nr:type 1 glutamine amidotransferase [Pseudomonadota bacterium]